MGQRLPKHTPQQKNDAPPTCWTDSRRTSSRCREEGNVKEEIAATRYLIKVEKDMAIRKVKESQTKSFKEAEAQRVSNSMIGRCSQKIMRQRIQKIELNLSNQNGILYKTALASYNE